MQRIRPHGLRCGDRSKLTSPASPLGCGSREKPDQIVVFSWRDRREPIETVTGTLEIPAFDVIVQARGDVADGHGLPAGEVAALGGGELAKFPPGGSCAAVAYARRFK